MRKLPVFLSVRARRLESVSGTPPVAQLILGSSGPGVEDSDNALFYSPHLLFVLFGSDEVGEALAGVFLISVFFSPLALLIAFDFLGWWRPLLSPWVWSGPPHPPAHG
jgi:hypothetical protein